MSFKFNESPRQQFSLGDMRRIIKFIPQIRTAPQHIFANIQNSPTFSQITDDVFTVKGTIKNLDFASSSLQVFDNVNLAQSSPTHMVITTFSGRMKLLDVRWQIEDEYNNRYSILEIKKPIDNDRRFIGFLVTFKGNVVDKQNNIV